MVRFTLDGIVTAEIFEKEAILEHCSDCPYHYLKFDDETLTYIDCCQISDSPIDVENVTEWDCDLQ